MKTIFTKPEAVKVGDYYYAQCAVYDSQGFLINFCRIPMRYLQRPEAEATAKELRDFYLANRRFT